MSKKIVLNRPIPVLNGENNRILRSNPGDFPMILRVSTRNFEMTSRQPIRSNSRRTEDKIGMEEEEEREIQNEEEFRLKNVKWILYEETVLGKKKMENLNKIKELQRKDGRYEYKYYKNVPSWKRLWRKIPSNYFDPKPIVMTDVKTLELYEEAAVIIQKYCALWKARMILRKCRKTRIKRGKILKEIIYTERDYINHLLTAERVFLTPMKEMAKRGKLITKEEMKLFSSYSVLVNINKGLLDWMLAATSKDHTKDIKSVGKVFLRIAPYFKMYRSYVINYQKVLKLWKKIKRRNKIFIEMEMDHRTTKLGFISYLILPVSRIPRYRLLLHELLKNTDEEHPDFINLLKAFDSVTQSADFLNSEIKKMHQAQEVQAIEKRIIGYPKKNFSLNRNLLIEQEVQFGFVKKKLKKILLFNDICMVTKISGRMCVFECELDLSNVRVMVSEDEKCREKDVVVRLSFPNKDLVLLFKSQWNKSIFVDELIEFVFKKRRNNWPPNIIEKMKNQVYIDLIIKTDDL